MFGAINKLVYKFRSSGPVAATQYLLFALFRRHEFVIFRADLPGLSFPEELLAGFAVVSDLEQVRRIREGHDLDQDFFRDRIDGCRNPALVMDGETIAAIGWVYDRDSKSRFFRLGDREMEVNYFVTQEKYRGRKIHGLLIQYLLREYRGKGYVRCYAGVHNENVNAIKSMERQGIWERIGRLVQYGPFRPRFRTPRG